MTWVIGLGCAAAALGCAFAGLPAAALAFALVLLMLAFRPG